VAEGQENGNTKLKVADHFRIHRPGIRRAMSRAYKQLLESEKPRENALGAYIYGLIDKMSFQGEGFTKKYRQQQTCNVRRTDPSILGEFRIDTGDPNYEHVLSSRANH
jgi:ribosomal protein S8E